MRGKWVYVRIIYPSIFITENPFHHYTSRWVEEKERMGKKANKIFLCSFYCYPQEKGLLCLMKGKHLVSVSTAFISSWGQSRGVSTALFFLFCESLGTACCGNTGQWGTKQNLGMWRTQVHFARVPGLSALQTQPQAAASPCVGWTTVDCISVATADGTHGKRGLHWSEACCGGGAGKARAVLLCLFKE